ncbi:glycosyltransferase family 4 protein [Flavobacterium lacus]|uniref:Glycosyltransferase involved in cell wall biosynthesis n=1 Tax=Flavobacterium lacus TaxID=1353778 RepID=A0A328WS12_9FLAO|nr:glycosyltransferase family 4 protein [Flavobacterium lacus]RAR47227.1 glycosyltransferase involved in cell wall biosynthesis [Flavobacterium lacus]
MLKLGTVVILDQASGYLQIDMLDALSTKYEKCVIIAGTIVERETKLSDNYTWHKIIKYNKSSSFRRVYTWVVSSIQMFFIIFFRYRNARIIAITNPPSAPLVPYLLKTNFDVLVYDLYPDALVNFNYIRKNGLVDQVFTNLTKRIFKKATTIYTLTPELARATSKYCLTKEIKIVPIWTNNEFFPLIARSENLIFKRLGIPDNAFLICYSGNLGKTHPVEILVELAKEFKNEPNFYFLIIGGGHKYDLINKLIEEQKLVNIKLLPWQPVELLPHNIQVGNINVVTLDEGAADLSIPSKTFNLLSVGKPILAICSKQSALSNLLIGTKSGIAYEPQEVEGIKTFIYELYSDDLIYQNYSKNAKIASHNFTKENANLFL